MHFGTECLRLCLPYNGLRRFASLRIQCELGQEMAVQHTKTVQKRYRPGGMTEPFCVLQNVPVDQIEVKPHVGGLVKSFERKAA